MQTVRKSVSILLMVLILFSSMGVMASEEPAIIKETIVVTEDGGRYQIGFINVEFKKNFLGKEELPKTFEVEIYAENGKPYIEFSPDVSAFDKKVHIRIDNYNGILYDKAQEKNVKMNIEKNNILARHFSRYCLIR